MIDLHTHSSFSDGVLTPSELVNKAFEKNIKVLSITDHDTVDGLEEGEIAAKEVGLTFVKGVELNIDWPTGEFHLLGLDLKEISPSLKKVLQFLQDERDKRNKLIINKMTDCGVDASIEEITSLFKTHCLGRPHFASYMVEKKIVKTRQAAFDKYLGKNCPWYVQRTGCDLIEAIQAIKDSGGVPVMAHPLSIYVSFGKIKNVFIELKEKGIEGLECYHPAARVGECKRLEELARELDFVVTAGSDYHGEAVRVDRKIGHTCGGYKIEDRFYEEFVEYRNRG